MKKRSEVEIKDTWKLEDMVASDSQWEQLFEEASSRVKQYADYKGRLDESADTLYACLKFDDEISRETELLYVYSRMRSDQDTADQKYQDMFSRAQSLSYRASEHSSYIVPEILAMPKETLDAYMKADNGISHFKRALEMVLNKREHTLSGSMSKSKSLQMRPYSRYISFFFKNPPAPALSRPRNMFCTTVRVGTRLSSW